MVREFGPNGACQPGEAWRPDSPKREIVLRTVDEIDVTERDVRVGVDRDLVDAGVEASRRKRPLELFSSRRVDHRAEPGAQEETLRLESNRGLPRLLELDLNA